MNKLKLEQFLFFLTILLLPTQFGKHFWPDFATIFSIKTDYFSPVLYFWDILVVILLFCFFIQRKRIATTPLTLFLIFILSQLISFFNSGNIGASFVRIEQYLIIGLFGLYIASQKFEFIHKPLYSGIIGAIIYSSIIAVLQVFKGGTLGLWILGERSFTLDTISIATFDWYGQVFLRAYATFPHPNVLAAFIFIFVSLLIFMRNESQRKVIEIITIIFGSIGLVLTFSRVGLLTYGVVVGYLLKSRIKLLALIILFLLPFLYVRFNSAFNFDQLSFIRREELALQSIELFRQSPYFGVGLNNFIYELAYGSIVSGEIRFLQPVHSIYLLTIVETGIFGFIGFLIFIAYPIILVIKRKNFILGFIWLGILGMGFFDHYYLTLAQGQRLLFLVWGISMLEYIDARSTQKSGWTNWLATNR